jgi:hypothetical protein
MPSRAGIAAFLAATALLSAWALFGRAAPRIDPPKGGRTPIVVELFSSEGCSSCPPADAYLNALDTTQPIDGVTVIALEFHVDYWDDIGWKDPFSSHAFTERQYAYARALSDRRVYTPELVVQGRSSIAPGDGARLKMLAREPGARVVVTRRGATVHVGATDIAASSDTLEVWVVVTERGLRTRVTAGENRDRTLEHAPVVRRLLRLGTASGPTYEGEMPISLDASWDAIRVHFVALVQERVSRRIVGAGSS